MKTFKAFEAGGAVAAATTSAFHVYINFFSDKLFLTKNFSHTHPYKVEKKLYFVFIVSFLIKIKGNFGKTIIGISTAKITMKTKMGKHLAYSIMKL